LRQPTLLIHGNRDTLAPAEASKWMAAHLPHARLRLIEGASHAPFLSHPTTFLSEALQFLASSPAASTCMDATETNT
jgi:pimeloyl-[acyl-carrier protein] methyl ester esterase